MSIIRIGPDSPLHFFEEIAQIHASELSAGLLARLGPRFLTRFYRYLSKQQNAVLFAACENDHINGFVLGTLNNKTIFRKYLQRQGFWILWYFLPLLGEIATWQRVLSINRYLNSSSPKTEKFRAELLSIAVAPQAHRQGLGRQLYIELSRYLAIKGISEFIVTAAQTQKEALRFYPAMGGTPLDQISVGGLDCIVFFCPTAMPFSCK